MNTCVTAMLTLVPASHFQWISEEKPQNGKFDSWDLTKGRGVSHLRIIPLKLMPMRPSRLVNTLELAASRRLQIAVCVFARAPRQPPCRVGFGTWALAVQLRLKPLGVHLLWRSYEVRSANTEEYAYEWLRE
jgi:hypothetical protein